MSFLIRKAVAADARSIFELRQRAIWTKCAADYSQAQLALWTQGEMSARFIADVERAFFVAESEQRVIASGMINVDDGMVDAIFVVPEFMGQGVAQAMLLHLEQLAREAGLPAMKLDSTLNAAAFYRRCGFVGDEISVYESPGGLQLACIPMEKSLLSTL